MSDPIKLNYWEECLSDSFQENGITVTREQLRAVANDVEIGRDCMGMAFYEPPASDRISVIESEWKAKCDRLQREFDAYRGNAETAVKQALRQHSDAHVTIGEYGEVLRHGGRTEQIQ